jgi:hypothetical protein
MILQLQKIHWKSTSRLSCANLIGLVKLSHPGASLLPEHRIPWGEIVGHGFETPDEFLQREEGKVAVSLSGISDLNASDLFQPGDPVALIDCKTFAPEFVPVLKAIENMKSTTLPFQNGQLLNLSLKRKVKLII